MSPNIVLELFLHDSQIANPLDLGEEALPSCVDSFDGQKEELKPDWLVALLDSDSDKVKTEVRIIKATHTVDGSGIILSALGRVYGY